MGLTAALAFLLALAASGAAHAQMWFPGAGQSENLVPRFDANGDGKLDQAERKAARDWIRAQGPGRRTAYRADRPTPSRSTLADDLQASSRATSPRGSELYDESVLRTIYLRFAAADWYDELADFYETGIEVPADLIVDGRVYRSVGVRFRGNSSYQMTGGSLKKPLNVSVDYEDPSQRIYGYRTLNLLNANTDPTFMREVLFSHIAGSYIPTPRACFVRLVINGEDWGVYVSAQQFNTSRGSGSARRTASASRCRRVEAGARSPTSDPRSHPTDASTTSRALMIPRRGRTSCACAGPWTGRRVRAGRRSSTGSSTSTARSGPLPWRTSSSTATAT